MYMRELIGTRERKYLMDTLDTVLELKAIAPDRIQQNLTDLQNELIDFMTKPVAYWEQKK